MSPGVFWFTTFYVEGCMGGLQATIYSNTLYLFLQFQSLKPGSSLLLPINSRLLDSFQINSDKIYSTYLKIASTLTHSLS